jgi:hypothetical protein
MSSAGLFNLLGFYSGYGGYYGNVLLGVFIAIMLMMAGLSVYVVVFNKNIIDNERLGPEEPLTLKTVAARFWRDYWRMLGNMILLLISLVIATFFLVLVMGGIGAVLTGFMALSEAIGVLFVILFLASMVVLIPIMIYVPGAALFVCQRDRINVFSAIGKVFYYMRNNFWNTWAVNFVGIIMHITLSAITQLPYWLLSILSTYSRVRSPMGYGVSEGSNPLLVVIVYAICSLLGFGVSAIYYLMTVYQYGSLEEKKGPW